MEIKDYLGIIISLVGGLLGAFVIVKVAIAELKKDFGYLKERLDTEIKSKDKMEKDHSSAMDEVRGDVKAIFRTLTAIQVDMAKSQGRDEVLNVVKDALEKITKK